MFEKNPYVLNSSRSESYDPRQALQWWLVSEVLRWGISNDAHYHRSAARFPFVALSMKSVYLYLDQFS